MKLSKVTDTDNARFYGMIGAKVCKNSFSSPKPFKSGFKVNTVKGIVKHEHLDCLAFTFEEDDSYVACYKCITV